MKLTCRTSPPLPPSLWQPQVSALCPAMAPAAPHPLSHSVGKCMWFSLHCIMQLKIIFFCFAFSFASFLFTVLCFYVFLSLFSFFVRFGQRAKEKSISRACKKVTATTTWGNNNKKKKKALKLRGICDFRVPTAYLWYLSCVTCLWDNFQNCLSTQYT